MQAPDGSPVAIHLRLRAHGEDEIIDRAVGPGAILELGCGVGRVTHALLARGRRVVAVDESPEMLAHVRGAATVCARIEELSLHERFAGVVLASRLVNAAREDDRRRRLAACARHVQPGGVVIVERWTPEQAARLRVGEVHRVDGVEIVAQRIERKGPDFSVALAHRADGEEWVQRFDAHVLDDAEFSAALSVAGLRHLDWLDAARAWSSSRLAAR